MKETESWAHEIRTGNYITLRSQWASRQLGYELPSYTLSDWARYERTPMGAQHAKNRELLNSEFDARVWPEIVALVAQMKHEGEPLLEPEAWVKSAKEQDQDNRAIRKAASRASSPRKRR